MIPAPRVPSLGPREGYVKQVVRDKLIDHKAYIREHGQDMPEVAEWRWGPTDTDNVGKPRRQAGAGRGGVRQGARSRDRRKR